MPRELSERDIVILKKLAPDCGDLDFLLALITERFSQEETKKVIEAFASFGVCER